MPMAKDDFDALLAKFARLTPEAQDEILGLLDAAPGILAAAGASDMSLREALDAGLVHWEHKAGYSILRSAPSDRKQTRCATPTSDVSPLLAASDGHVERWEAAVSHALQQQPATQEELHEAYSYLCFEGWLEGGSLAKAVVWLRLFKDMEAGTSFEELVRMFPIPGDPPPNDAITRAPLN